MKNRSYNLYHASSLYTALIYFITSYKKRKNGKMWKIKIRGKEGWHLMNHLSSPANSWNTVQNCFILHSLNVTYKSPVSNGQVSTLHHLQINTVALTL
jgi:hypothetical protein